MEQKDFDDMMNKIALAIEPVYNENKKFKTALLEKTELEERYRKRIRLLENELQERDVTLTETDRAYGKQRKNYLDIDSNFRKLYRRVKDNFKLWQIINKKNSKIKSLKEEIASLKESYEEDKK